LSLILSGCKKDLKVAFIQGEWDYKYGHLGNLPGESAEKLLGFSIMATFQLGAVVL
jgi:hypothetical protein